MMQYSRPDTYNAVRDLVFGETIDESDSGSL